MFKPIIHNLKEGDKGFKEAQLYNLHISSKPTGGNLKEKIESQRVWKEYGNLLLNKAKKAIKD